jgi:hypothetical protein
MSESSQILMYQTEDLATEIAVRLEQETVWLSQKQMSELFQTTVANINQHIANVFEEGELSEEAVIKNYLITASDGKNYDTKHYNLDVIISVGYRVRSHRGTQFRIWATQRLREYLVKGFTLDDARLADGKTDYFDELLERVRSIRTSERMFWQKVTDIYSTSLDYDANAQVTRDFFATIQNKFHFAIHGHTAAELISERVSADKPNMGLTTWKNAPKGPIRKGDTCVAKNYLNENELKQLNLIVDQYLSFAELQAQQRKPMHMSDWVRKLHEFLTLNDREILKDTGKISHDLAKELAEKQFNAFEKKRRKLEAQKPTSDFDKTINRIEQQRRRKKNDGDKGGDK